MSAIDFSFADFLDSCLEIQAYTKAKQSKVEKVDKLAKLAK
jgi:hypothetical protein